MSEPIGRKVERVQCAADQLEPDPSTPGFKGNFPRLWQFLAIRRDLGEIHQTGSVTLFIDGEKIKLCVNDRPSRQSCFMSGDTLMEALLRVDRGLAEGTLRWSSAGYKRRPAKKVYKRTGLLDG
jgi:hypothetical protein